MRRLTTTLFLLLLSVGVTADLLGQTTQPVLYTGTGHYYQYVQFTPSICWTAARDFAIAQGGYLATVQSSGENAFIRNTFQENPARSAWLGGYEPNNNGVWAWANGEPWGYTNWYSGQPSNSGGIENYLGISGGTFWQGRWNDAADCNPPVGLIIEFDSNPSLSSAPRYYFGNGHYYQVVPTSGTMTWDQCRNAAVAMGGYLASVTNQGESDFLLSLPQPGIGTFIGGLETSPGVWTWVSGEPWSYTSWNTGEPSNVTPERETTLELYTSRSVSPRLPGRWNNVMHNAISTEFASYIVEFNSDPTPSSSAPFCGTFDTQANLTADWITVQGSHSVVSSPTPHQGTGALRTQEPGGSNPYSLLKRRNFQATGNEYNFWFLQSNTVGGAVFMQVDPTAGNPTTGSARCYRMGFTASNGFAGGTMDFGRINANGTSTQLWGESAPPFIMNQWVNFFVRFKGQGIIHLGFIQGATRFDRVIIDPSPITQPGEFYLLSDGTNYYDDVCYQALPSDVGRPVVSSVHFLSFISDFQDSRRFRVNVKATDVLTGNSDIVKIEYFFGSTSLPEGSGTPASPTNRIPAIEDPIVVVGYSGSNTIFNLRVMDAAGNWSPLWKADLSLNETAFTPRENGFGFSNAHNCKDRIISLSGAGWVENSDCCMGMALTTLVKYQKGVDISTINTWPLPETELFKEIVRNQDIGNSEWWWTISKLSKGLLDNRSGYEAVRQRITSKKPALIGLNGNNVGHAVVGALILEMGEERVIGLYDPNSGRQLQELVFNANTAQFLYSNQYNRLAFLPPDHHSLTYVGQCPIDLELVDPLGMKVSPGLSEIPEAAYLLMYSEGDTDTAKAISVLQPIQGTYILNVNPSIGTPDDSSFSIFVNFLDTTYTLADNVSLYDQRYRSFKFFTGNSATLAVTVKDLDSNGLVGVGLSIYDSLGNLFKSSVSNDSGYVLIDSIPIGCYSIAMQPILGYETDSLTKHFTVNRVPVTASFVLTKVADVVMSQLLPASWSGSWSSSSSGTIRSYIGNIPIGHTASNIAPSTIRLNGQVPIMNGQSRVRPSMAGFTGSVLEVAFNRQLAVQSLPQPLTNGIHTVLITGDFTDGQKFIASVDITLSGASAKEVADGELYDEEVEVLPADFFLGDAHPNPFNPSTTIDFGLPEQAQVRLEVINMLGQKVRTLADGEFGAGNHSVSWDGTSDTGAPVASGVYLYRLQAGSFSETKKMILMK